MIKHVFNTLLGQTSTTAIHKRLLSSALLCTAISLTGCVTNNFPGSYTEKADKFRAAMNTGETKESLEYLASQQKSEDIMLYMMESSRIQNVGGKYPESLADLNTVIAKFEANDGKALISAGAAIDNAQAVLVNDTMLEYQGYDYERIFAHVHQSLNYLGQKKTEDALVEVRKIALEEKQLTESHEKELQKSAKEAKDKKIDTNKFNEQFSGIDLVAGKTKSSFSNAYAHYISGVLMESTGKKSDKDFALTSYKLAYELNPSLKFIKKDITRISPAKNGKGKKQEEKPDGENGNVVVLYEDNFVAKRTGIMIPIPTPDGGAVAVAFPLYTKESIPAVNTLKVSGQGVALETVEITNVSALAAKALKEKIPGMVFRAFIRVLAKYELQHVAAQKGGDAGLLAASAYNVVSEQPDLRNWLTLPNSCQVAKTAVKPGKQTLSLSSAGVNATTDIDAVAGHTTLVRVVNTGTRLVIQTFQL